MDHPDRLPGLSAEGMSPAARKLLNVTVERTAPTEAGGGGPPRHKPLHILTVMAHHPTLLGPFIEWATALALYGELPKRAQEILALRAAIRCQSEFEWGHHVVYGRAAGLSDEEIARIAAGDRNGWAAHEGVLLDAADELITGFDLSDATWSTLRAHYSDAQLAEIPFVVGQYTMLSMFANGLGVALEPGYAPLP